MAHTWPRSETAAKQKNEDMSTTEQRVLEDFDGKKLQRQHENLRVQKPQHFH